MTDQLTPNHIHADHMDILAPLRLGTRRCDEGNARSKEFFQRLSALDIFVLEELHMLFEANAMTGLVLHPRQSQLKMLLLCLDEAANTASREGFVNVARRTMGLANQLSAGRNPTILVTGRCQACWPEVAAAVWEPETPETLLNNERGKADMPLLTGKDLAERNIYLGLYQAYAWQQGETGRVQEFRFPVQDLVADLGESQLGCHIFTPDLTNFFEAVDWLDDGAIHWWAIREVEGGSEYDTSTHVAHRWTEVYLTLGCSEDDSMNAIREASYNGDSTEEGQYLTAYGWLKLAKGGQNAG